MRTALNKLGIAMIGFGVAFILGFSNFNSPPRHPAAISDTGNSSRRMILYGPSSGVPGVITTPYKDTIFNITTGLGAGTLLATGQIYAATTVTAPLTLDSMTIYVSAASSNTAANEVLTVTDGTNTCTFTYSCSGTLPIGTAIAAATNGAGTGCTYANAANLTVSTTTQGCGTAATVKSIQVFAYINGT